MAPILDFPVFNTTIGFWASIAFLAVNSNSENVEVSFGNQNLKTEKISIRLPEIERINDKFNYDQLRALADSESLKIRFSNKKTYKSFEPEGNISKKLYEVAEKIRFEKLGSEQFKGVKNNIDKYFPVIKEKHKIIIPSEITLVKIPF